jgi:hypothetical protein
VSAVFLEVIIDATDFGISKFEGRDEIEDPLNDGLSDAGLGEVTGGGAGSGALIVDVEINSELHFPEALSVMRRILREVAVPTSTVIKRHSPREIIYQVYE